MKKFQVTFTDTIEAETEEEAHAQIRQYCFSVAHSGDVTAFEFLDIGGSTFWRFPKGKDDEK